MNKEKIKELVKKEWRLAYFEKITGVINTFSLTEKVIFSFLILIFMGTGISLLWQVNKQFLVEVPDYGGTLTEGVIGSPRFINPLLSVSDIDRDLSGLIYSGLLKFTSDGNLIPDLAKSFTISNDSLTYTFVLKDDIYFHDGIKVTSDDVIYTIEMAQDPNLKSPRKANWDGVKVQKVNDKTVSLTLKQPYSPFIVNATLGILPRHIWSKATIDEFPFSQFNTKPVGTGPYKIDSISYTSSGLPSEYNLISNPEYSLGKPYITNLVVKSYQNEKDAIEAYKNGNIESIHGISPKELPNLKIQDDNIVLSPLPRVFGVFFNQNIAPVFVHKEVRQALNIATNKQDIINIVLQGYGQSIDEPVPPKTLSETSIATSSEQEEIKNIEKAKSILVSKGWKQNSSGIFEKKEKKSTVTLSFSISTGNAPELKAVASILQREWQKLGAKVDVKIFEINDLNQNIIRTRKYDSLFFGEVVGRDLDLYPFWHSSERVDPGLNIALYTNIKADKFLENIRKTTDPVMQKTYYESFNKEIGNDIPAVFVYSPYFIYIVPKKVQNIKLGNLTTPAERFSDISKWYIETNNVWKIFTK